MLLRVFCIDGKIHSWKAGLLVLLYVTCVIVVVAGMWWRKHLDLKQLIPADAAAAHTEGVVRAAPRDHAPTLRLIAKQLDAAPKTAARQGLGSGDSPARAVRKILVVFARDSLPAGSFGLPVGAHESVPDGPFALYGCVRESVLDRSFAHYGSTLDSLPAGPFALYGCAHDSLPAGSFALPVGTHESAPAGSFLPRSALLLCA
ncbi:hypothetical protein AURDEDRAFT_161077 [Auricularia subglabra TFB-10046 SS5]|nr:hypothetical protein AURDEDRAFT_161077 [Auricularia subglabra TFB-10046 SS5]